MTKKELNTLLTLLIENGGSDLHISADKNIRIRINGKLVPIDGPIYQRESLVNLLKEILRSRWEEMIKKKNLDFSYKLNEEYSFRGNAFFQKDGPGIVFRVIPNKIPSLDDLGLPQSIKTFIDKTDKGLILVTGVTGSGKSTTLAAIINEINNNRFKHILTLEDPIEFVHKSKKSLVNQRNIGEDALNFNIALKAALREDPDIILIGEMRDKETIEIALHAAETGHLVLSTLHTLDSKETINRIIGTFPPEEQYRIRLVLGNILQGVISQRLIPTVDNKRIAAMEILFKTPRIKQLILENRDQEIRKTLEEGYKIYGTQTFDIHLIKLVIKGIISEEVAMNYTSNLNDFILKLKQEKAKLLKDNQKENLKDILKLKQEN